jgi:hypothetical protein
MSGTLLLIFGAWAALAPMVGPYIDVAYTPAPNDAWHWTAARGWLEVLPGAAAFLGGLLLLLSASRVMTLVGGWLAAAGGAWLIVGPPLADVLNLTLGVPDPAGGPNHRAFDSIVLFYGIGALILFVAGTAIGRLSVVSLRDVQAAERRAAEEDADVAAMTSYPPARPVGEETEGERVAAGRRGFMDSEDQPTTQLPQTAATGQPGQQAHFPGGYQPQYPPGEQQPHYSTTALPRESAPSAPPPEGAPTAPPRAGSPTASPSGEAPPPPPRQER